MSPHAHLPLVIARLWVHRIFTPKEHPCGSRILGNRPVLRWDSGDSSETSSVPCITTRTETNDLIRRSVLVGRLRSRSRRDRPPGKWAEGLLIPASLPGRNRACKGQVKGQTISVAKQTRKQTILIMDGRRIQATQGSRSGASEVCYLLYKRPEIELFYGMAAVDAHRVSAVGSRPARGFQQQF